jgi:hypothetical protein
MPPAPGPPSSPRPQPSPSGSQTPDSSNRRHWVLLGVAVTVVVAVVVGMLVWNATATSPGGRGAPTAEDGVDRTVGLLRVKDPVCDEWVTVSNELAAKEEKWAASNRGVPATAWSPEQREIFVSVGEAMSTAADQFESMLPKAKNVVLQELIAQTIVYLRAYVERVPNYVDSDGLIAGVANNFGGAITYMCSAAPLAPSASAEGKLVSSAAEPAALTPFMAHRDSVCRDFLALIDRQSAQLSGWIAGDSTKPAAKWIPKERALNNAAREVLKRDYRQLLELGKRAKNPIMSDLLLTQSAYIQTFSRVLPSYTPDDAQLWTVVTFLGGGLSSSCKAEL